MQAPSKHRFKVEDYHRMAETGVLREDARVELLDGQIIDMSPIGPFHGGVVNRLNRLFSRYSEERWIVSTQNPIRLNDFSEPEPDLMLLKPAPDDYTSRHPTAADVFLLIEVADTTLPLDRKEKLPAYGRAGVAEVWIVNLEEQKVEIYREPHFTGYGSKSVLSAGSTASPAKFADVTVDVAALLKH
ncbi:MAG: Uma2 family endonuclease [Opitutaceae bacterium]|nr:Uma2 family endonuclease [Verrucomicrobiales bacterium]